MPKKRRNTFLHAHHKSLSFYSGSNRASFSARAIVTYMGNIFLETQAVKRNIGKTVEMVD